MSVATAVRSRTDEAREIALRLIGERPGTIVWVGFLAAVLQVLGGIALFAKSGFFAGGGAITFLAPIVSTLWIVGVSILLFRAPSPASAGP